MTTGKNEEVGDPELFLTLHSEFSQLAKDDRPCESNADPQHAYGQYGDGNGDAGAWKVSRGTSTGYNHARFEELGTRAGIAAGTPPQVKPLTFWLHGLFLSLLESDPEHHLTVASRETGGFIQRVCFASATYCLRLAKAARESQHKQKLQRINADYKPLPKPVKPVGGFASAALPYPRQITGWMRYQYPPDFPEKPSRDRVKAAELMAAREFNKKSVEIRSERELLTNLITAALRPVAVFCEEAVRLGWGASRIDPCFRELVREAQVWVGLRRYEEHLSPELQLQFEQSPQWEQCQDIYLLRVDESERDGESNPPTASSLQSPIELDPATLPTAGQPPPSASTLIDKLTAKDAKKARAKTVAKLIDELNQLKPQMIDDDTEYGRLRDQYPGFLAFKISEKRRDLKMKVQGISGSNRHIRLAQELAAAYHGRQLSTIQDDWKDHKPDEFKRLR